jgi:tetratricopeptide (TPR) repeat protein
MKPQDLNAEGFSGRCLAVLSRPLFVLAGLLIVAFVLYGRTLPAPFVYDDHELLLASPLIKNLSAPLENWQAAGTKLVAFWTFAVNYSLGAQNSFGYHVVNVMLHSLNAWLLYLLVQLFFKTPRLENSLSNPDVVAFVAAIIFLCHPLQTESVSYVWQRTELLNAFFYLMTLACYLQGRLKAGNGYFLLAAILFVFGFYSKGMIVSLPLLILVLEDAFFDAKRIFLRSLGILIIGIQLLFWHIPVIDDFRAKFFYGLMAITGTMITPTHVYTQIDVIARYILLTIFPVFQNLDHSVALIATFWHPRVIFSAVLILFVLALAIDVWKKNRLIAFGIFWFFIALLPSSLLGGREPMVEHRLYFSIAGFALAVSAVFVVLMEQKRKYLWLAVVGVGVLSLLTMTRNYLWQSPRLLFEDTVRKSPDKARPALMLGTVYLTQNRIEQAESMFVRALKADPQSVESYNNLGLIYWDSGRTMAAEQMFEKSIAVRNDFAPAYINLGYFVLGIGDDDRAQQLFQKAMDLGKKDAALVGLGQVAMSQGRVKDAKAFLLQAITVGPQNYKAYLSLGDIYFAQKNDIEAIEYYQKAVALQPNLREAYLKMGNAYSRRGDYEKAQWVSEKVGALE